MSKKPTVRGPFDKQHGKQVQTLLKSVPQHHYHIYRLLSDTKKPKLFRNIFVHF